MSTRIDDLSTGMAKAIEEAYQRGLADGRKEVSERVREVIDGPTHNAVVEEKALPLAVDRAPRGLVGDLIDQVLTDHPGIPGVDVEDRVLKADSRIARKSVGNTLRRYRDEKYRKEGRNWFLIGDAEKETAETGTNQDSAALEQQTERSPLWNHPNS